MNEQTRMLFAKSACYLWIAMAAVLPFSTALTLLFTYAALTLSALGSSRKAVILVLRHPLVIACVLLWFWLSLSALWSVAPQHELFEGWSKYRKLVFVVPFAVSFLVSGISPLRCFTFFAGVNAILAGLAILIWLIQLKGGGINFGGIFYVGDSSNPTVGRNHITQGAFFLFSAVVALYGASNSHVRSARLAWGLTAILLAVTAVGLQQGRTAYVLYIVLILALSVVFVLQFRIRLALISIILGVSLGGLLWGLSPHTKSRSVQAMDEISKFSNTSESLGSQGIRLSFYRAGIAIASDNFLVGTGVGSFAQSYSLLETEPISLRNSRAQPHSEFILQLCQGGLIGLSLWLFVIFTAIRYCFSQFRESGLSDKVTIGIVCVLYFCAAAFNSFVWDLAEGHLFIILIGVIVVLSITSPRIDLRLSGHR